MRIAPELKALPIKRAHRNVRLAVEDQRRDFEHDPAKKPLSERFLEERHELQTLLFPFLFTEAGPSSHKASLLQQYQIASTGHTARD